MRRSRGRGRGGPLLPLALILLVLAAALCALPFLLTGCLPGIAQYTQEAPAGFLNGIWHGWCAPITLIMEMFGANVHLYAEYNTGLSYELGFYMAVISGFGGLALTRKKRRHGD